MREELAAERRPDDEATIVGHARTAGLEPVDRIETPDGGSTPRVAADRLEERSLSWMWSVPDADWSRVVPPALARLRALPDQDRPRPAPGPTLLAFTRP